MLRPTGGRTWRPQRAPAVGRGLGARQQPAQARAAMLEGSLQLSRHSSDCAGGFSTARVDRRPWLEHLAHTSSPNAMCRPAGRKDSALGPRSDRFGGMGQQDGGAGRPLVRGGDDGGAAAGTCGRARLIPCPGAIHLPLAAVHPGLSSPRRVLAGEARRVASACCPPAPPPRVPDSVGCGQAPTADARPPSPKSSGSIACYRAGQSFCAAYVSHSSSGSKTVEQSDWEQTEDSRGIRGRHARRATQGEARRRALPGGEQRGS